MMRSLYIMGVGRGRAPLGQGDLVPGPVEGDLVHVGPDQEQAAPVVLSRWAGSVGSGNVAGSNPGPSSRMT